MVDETDLEDATRRTVLKGAAGTLGLAAMGSASAHEWGRGEDEESGPAGTNAWTSQRTDTRGETEGAEVVGYHALGDVGTARSNRKAEARDPHYGGITEIRTHGDYAYVTFFSSDAPTPGRSMAILDISDYNRIPADASEDEQSAMLENAEISVVSYLRNNNTAAAVMDVKVSDDGNYVFLSTQPYTALFGGYTGNTQDPTHSEVADPTPNTEDSSYTAQPGGIVAVDVSDKANPETLGLFTLEGTGCHNAYYHRIGGDEYVFAIQDSGNLAYVGEGMFVLRFDRDAGSLELVNRWHFETNNRQGEVSTSGAYIHDMEVQDDPRTGTPVVYLAYWDRGMWALDASDPENLEALGHFDMWASHFAAPAPTLVNGKRVVVTSQEVSESDLHTGRVYLVDADGLFESDPNYDTVPRKGGGVARLGELDMWEWQNEYQYPDTDNAVEFGPYDFSLSPHNSDFARHVDPDTGEESFWIHQAHYGGGVRFLKVEPGTDDGLVGRENRFEIEEDEPDTVEEAEESCSGGGVPVADPETCTGEYEIDGAGGPHFETDWSLTEKGFSRPTYGTPKDSRIEGLNYITPFVWGASQSNGITFASDINQGVHAVRADGVPIGGADPVVGVTRTDAGRLFTGGGTNQVDLRIDFADGDVLVRDRLPEGWSVVGGDDHSTTSASGSTYVVFDGTHGGGDSLTYFAEAPSTSGNYTFGPVQVSDDGGQTWHTLAGTTGSATVAGTGTALGTAAGAVGVLGSQRERLKERVGGFLGDEE